MVFATGDIMDPVVSKHAFDVIEPKGKVSGEAPHVEVVGNYETGQTLVATADLAVGETVAYVTTGAIVPTPTRHSFQVDLESHLDSGDDPMRYADHSCDPNCAVSIEKSTDSACGYVMRFYTVKPVSKGQRLTWNYLATEWDMQSPFDCLCGATTCVRAVRGYKHLSPAQQESLALYLAPAVQQMAKAHSGSGGSS